VRAADRTGAKKTQNKGEPFQHKVDQTPRPKSYKKKWIMGWAYQNRKNYKVKGVFTAGVLDSGKQG